MEKNDLLTLVCERLGTNGEGVSRCGDVTVFTPRFYLGEKALVRILSVKGRVAYGRIEELHTPAEERVRPVCRVFGKCGGCQLQHIRYRNQLDFKTELVKNTLKKIGGIETAVSPCVASGREFGYRNKLILPLGNRDGRLVAGFYAERTHRIVETDDCPIHPEWAGKVIAAIKRFADTCGLEGYDEATGKGALRHLVVRELNGRFLVVLVAAEREIKGIDFLLFLLDGIFSDYGFFLNFNDKRTNVIFGEEFRLLKGSPVYECREAGIVFEAGAETFVQINGDVRAKLYERAVALADAEDVVVDCYAGGGLLTAMFAKKCRRAYGIEVVAEASECADRLKKANGLSGKMTNIVGRVEDELQGVLKKEKNAVLVLDPPRAGIARSVLNAILQSGAEKVILISCNPATLARDLGLLTGTLQENAEGALISAVKSDGTYELVSVQPFDMFPQTKHVETLVVLSKKIPDSHINIDVEFGESEGQFSLKKIKERAESRKPKEKVTYKKMQDYIEQTYGFKVHTAYIAEVKRDLGLPMYDAPNAVEELKHPRPHPTPKMVEAIKETLKHFEII